MQPFIFRPSGRKWDEEVDGPRPARAPAPEAPPLELPEDGAAPTTEALLEHYLSHWKACRKQRQARRLPQASVAYLSGLMADKGAEGEETAQGS